MERRLGGCLSLFSLLLGTATWPVEAFLIDRRKKCAHFLNFLLIFLGWVLPLFLVTRRTVAASGAIHTPNSATRGAARGAARGAPHGAARAANAAQQSTAANQRAALWLSQYAFMDGQPLMERLWAWYFLAVLSWLVAQLPVALGCS